MFDHRNLATEGLYPGLVSTFSIAVLGALEFEITLEKIGGGGFGGPVLRKDKYRLSIVVRRKDRTWKYETVISQTFARVIAKLENVKKKEPSIVVESVRARVEEMTEPTIRVTKK